MIDKFADVPWGRGAPQTAVTGAFRRFGNELTAASRQGVLSKVEMLLLTLASRPERSSFYILLRIPLFPFCQILFLDFSEQLTVGFEITHVTPSPIRYLHHQFHTR